MISDLNDPVVYSIVEARIKLLFAKPFIGNLAARMVLIDASAWCNTAATDGRNLYYNREFIKSLTKEELLFLISHEVLHVCYDHIGRCGNRDPKVHNMAIDYIVNYVLVNDQVGKMPSVGLYDKRFTDEMTSEEVYEILMKESVTIKVPMDHHLSLKNENDDDNKCGGEAGENNENGEVEVRVMGKNGPPKLTQEDIEKIKQETRAAMIQAAQACGAGSVPAGIRRLIDSLISPKMNWKELLDTHIRSSIKDDFTFQRISRRSWDSGFIMPGQNFQDTIDVTCFIDCSGSMTEEMLKGFLSEIKGIMETFRDYKLGLAVFDTQVYNYLEYSPENQHDGIENYPIAGGGGTMFECCWEFMKREHIQPQRLIIFTDGMPNASWGSPEYCETLFVIYGNQQRNIVAPFGITAYYEED